MGNELLKKTGTGNLFMVFGEPHIAAWFLDNDYDGEAFFVRHAYLTGADDPYDKLRALRADISDEAWFSVNSTVSRSFPRPRSGKIAIKVSNHHGDVVTKVQGTQ